MQMERTISTKSQIVIPKDVMKKAGLKPRSKIVFDVENGKITIKKSMSAKEFVDDLLNVPKRLKKTLSAQEIKRIIEEEYEIP